MIRQYLIHGAINSGFELTERQIFEFELFVSELKKWNRSINLTSLQSDKDIVVKHIIDSLFMASITNNSEVVLDIGSGAGIPALPIKIFKPDVTVISVDAVGKKTQFQRHVARILKLNGFEAIHARVEQLSVEHFARYQVVTSRAFASLLQFIVVGEKFLAPTGRMIALKGPLADSELEECNETMQLQGLSVSSIRKYRLPYDLGERRMIEIKRANADKQAVCGA